MTPHIQVFSPGRINIIGEHTDHQGGLVLPAAIQLGITVELIENYNKEIEVSSNIMKETRSINIKDNNKNHDWTDYITGSFKSFWNFSDIEPEVNVRIHSTLPVGSGLSSSAALEVGCIKALAEYYNLDIRPQELAFLAWEAETKFVGVQCGIMDQMIIASSQDPSPLKINCTTMKTEVVNLSQNIRFLLINTAIQRNLITSEYNTRILELREAKNILQKLNFEYNSILDIDIKGLNEIEEEWNDDPTLLNRLTHVIQENHRVEAYTNHVNMNNYIKAGEELTSSHDSLKNLFDASWDEADKIVEIGSEIDAVQGLRMVGAGWGGNVLVQYFADDSESIIKEFLNQLNWLTPHSFTNITVGPGVRRIY